MQLRLDPEIALLCNFRSQFMVPMLGFAGVAALFLLVPGSRWAVASDEIAVNRLESARGPLCLLPRRVGVGPE